MTEESLKEVGVLLATGVDFDVRLRREGWTETYNEKSHNNVAKEISGIVGF